MPFKSSAQSRAAFGGYLGREMKEKAGEWASKTDYSHLPEHKKPVPPRFKTRKQQTRFSSRSGGGR